MDELQIENWPELTEQFFSGRLDLDSVAVRYTPEQICDFYMSNIERLQGIVSTMSPTQLAYRMPGSPTGADSSGDEEHFDTSQIATHLASGTTFHWRNMARTLGTERPIFTRPPEGAKTTAQNKGILGGGGWSDVPAAELARTLGDTAVRFVAYVRELPPDTDMTRRFEVPGFANLSAQGWLFLAGMHSAMHLRQVEEMLAQPDYPAVGG